VINLEVIMTQVMEAPLHLQAVVLVHLQAVVLVHLVVIILPMMVVEAVEVVEDVVYHNEKKYIYEIVQLAVSEKS
jgi:hypothetical protein